MPRLSRYFVRAALLYLAIGLTLGGFILAAKGGVGDVLVWRWLPVHIVLLINGWLIQFSLGVAYWILPRIKLNERGRKHWAWGGFWLFEGGLALTLASALTLWLPDSQLLFLPGLVLQSLGAAAFAVHAWPRIRPALARSG